MNENMKNNEKKKNKKIIGYIVETLIISFSLIIYSFGLFIYFFKDYQSFLSGFFVLAIFIIWILCIAEPIICLCLSLINVFTKLRVISIVEFFLNIISIIYVEYFIGTEGIIYYIIMEIIINIPIVFNIFFYRNKKNL